MSTAPSLYPATLNLSIPLRFRRGRSNAFSLLVPLRSSQSSPLRFSPRKAPSATTLEALQKQQKPDEEEPEKRKTQPHPPLDLEALSDVSLYKDMRSLPSPELQVIELEDLPEQWRRSKIAWLCKELPSHKHSTFVRILNAHRKWITQDDATYIAVHCMRIRENEASFRVYKWMSQQHWFQFNFALATKLADYLGKDRKFAKCRELFDAIVNQGRIPSESTFHILVAAYLSAPVEGCSDEACSIYNKMIQLGGYRPRLSLHNSLFRALINRDGSAAKHYLRQAEFIYHNIVTSDLEVHKDIYAGLLLLHSFQDVIDMDRIVSLREEFRKSGHTETKDVLLSIIRAYSRAQDVEETEKTWLKLLESGCSLPSQAFVCRMELYAKVDQPVKSLEIFKGMMKQNVPVNASVYLKIIEVMSRAREVEVVEDIFDQFLNSRMKPLIPAFQEIMSMYFNLGMHDKLEKTFSKCLANCQPTRSIYTIYLESLVRIGNFEKAEEIFNEMHTNATVGSSARSCNIILEGYLTLGDCVKAENIYDTMCLKKYDIEPHSLEKLQEVLSLNRKVVRRKVSMKLDVEQREILVALLLGGGVQIESDPHRRNHIIHFQFSMDSDVHSFLKVHVHQRFYEWLNSSGRSFTDDSEIPSKFSTIAHSYFGFFADQFWSKGTLMIPKLIHRWLSSRVLAYWYMFGGYKAPSGDIMLKLKGGSHEDVERIFNALKAKCISFKIKRKGKTIWIGFQESNATSFWKLVEPYVLENIKDTE